MSELLDSGRIEYVRTGSSTKDKLQVSERFGLTLALVPDFIVHKRGALRAFLECKSINDGGTARDKASRFQNYRREAEQRGGIPVIAVLNGKGWERGGDALGPVVQHCDGRVFTPATLNELLTYRRSVPPADDRGLSRVRWLGAAALARAFCVK